MKTTRRISAFGRAVGLTITLGVVLLGGISFANAAILNRQLQVGMSGADVTALQSFLAEDVTIYPEGLVTGYFGPLTMAAVMKYQTKNGIDPVGRVGPITLASITTAMNGGGVVSGGAPVISNVSVTTSTSTANIAWTTNENAKGVVYFDTKPLTEYEMPGSVTISGSKTSTDGLLHSSQNIILSNLVASTTYYYDIYVTDGTGNVSMTQQTTFKTSN